jgi:hypothetical protein
MTTKKLYEVTVEHKFYWYGDCPPDRYEVEEAVRSGGVDTETYSSPVTTNTIGWPNDSLVFGPNEDVTVEEALAEVNKED